MSKYVGKYADQTALQNAIDGGTLLKPYVAYVSATDSLDYNSKSIDYSSKYFTIKAIENTTISWAPSGTVEYSVNEGTWNTWDNTNGLSVNANDEVRFRSTANNTYIGKAIGSTGKIEVFGNSMSLAYGDNFTSQTNFSSFAALFLGNTKLVNAGNLVLPATRLSNYAYQQMFSGCTNLTIAPSLPHASGGAGLSINCYERMFSGCSNLSYIKCLSNPSNTSSYTYEWVKGVAATGTFVKKSGATWRSGNDGIPTGWTVVEE